MPHGHAVGQHDGGNALPGEVVGPLVTLMSECQRAVAATGKDEDGHVGLGLALGEEDAEGRFEVAGLVAVGLSLVNAVAVGQSIGPQVDVETLGLLCRSTQETEQEEGGKYLFHSF